MSGSVRVSLYICVRCSCFFCIKRNKQKQIRDRMDIYSSWCINPANWHAVSISDVI